MTRFTKTLTVLATLCLAPHVGAQITLISDDLNVDTSTDYTVVNGGHGAPDGSLDWAFDYSTLIAGDGNPIPPAPGTTDGSTRGVKIQVNNTAGGDPADSEATTIFHNTAITGVQDYTLTVDVFLGVWSTSPDTGSTEHAHIGVAGDGATVNQLFQASPFTLSGSGNYVAISGDGGDSSDYRHWRDDANGSGAPGPVNQFDLDYLSTDQGTNVTGDNFPFFEQISNFNAPFPGSIGDAWATVKVEVSQTDGRLRYYVRGANDVTTGDPFNPAPAEFIQIIDSPLFDTDGFVSFGLGDLYSSVAVDPNEQYAIFDNLLVEGSGVVVTPNCDFDGNMTCDLDDIDMLTQATSSGSMDLMFDLNGDMLVNADDIGEWLVQAGADPSNSALTGGNPFLDGDANLDGVVDGQDFIVWNGSKFSGTGLYSLGDFNGDGITDGQDFIVWNGNKFTGSMDISSVPEPATATLLLLGALVMIRRRR